ncbi:MAG: dTDP-4-dehydrorhamnose reductase [Burkholderiales bacterium]
MPRILLTGKTGQVGWELQRALAALGSVIALDRAQLDLASPDSIRKAVRDAAPDIIVNAAAYTAVDKAEAEAGLAMQVNAVAPGIMAEEARRLGALLVHYSTDYVFDGTKAAPYVEEDLPHPLNAYGKSKLEGERAIAATGCAHLILRTSWIYAGRGSNFVLTILELARQRPTLAVVDDQIGCPTWARFIAEATAALLADPARARDRGGIYHLSAAGATSRFDFARKIIELAAQLSGEKNGWAEIRPTTTAQYPLPAQRPLNCSTSKDKIIRTFGIRIPQWTSLLRACLECHYGKTAAKHT